MINLELTQKEYDVILSCLHASPYMSLNEYLQKLMKDKECLKFYEVRDLLFIRMRDRKFFPGVYRLKRLLGVIMGRVYSP